MKTFRTILGLLVVAIGASQAVPQSSVHVGIIGSPRVVNGGTFPTSGAGLAGMTFANLAPANVNAANLANYDTILLNVASAELGENVNNLPVAAKNALLVWLAEGHKLIIYDSEAPAQDYSWLPYPFKTNNPGAQGAQGTLVIVEENTLSSNDSASPYYINAALVGSGTDAVGDANVMTTLDGNWKIDMTARNINSAVGPVHTYAEYPSNALPGAPRGLIIYNGLDVDHINMSNSAALNLREIYVQELQQLFNPSGLIGIVSVVGITLDPSGVTNPVGTAHTVVAKCADQLGVVQAGVLVTFQIISGPGVGAEAAGTYVPATRLTDANGEVRFTYVNNGNPGTDQIVASFQPSGTPVPPRRETPPVSKIWQVPAFPVLTSTPAANRGYYALTASSAAYPPASLEIYVKDTASAFVAGPFASGTIVRLRTYSTTGIAAGFGPASVTINVRGNGMAYAVDPAARTSASVMLRAAPFVR